jgi:diaminopimelate epimerase
MTRAIAFDKVHASGNDMILVEQALARDEIARICDRHHGAGADGVMTFVGVQEGRVILDHHDPDGSESLCVNGTRASLACLHQRGKIPGKGRVMCAGTVMNYVVDPDVTLELTLSDVDIREVVWKSENTRVPGHLVNVGNPHFVILDPLPLDRFRRVAPTIRQDDMFSEGANVHLLTGKGTTRHIYSFERGVEGFTKACGSGMIASGVLLMRTLKTNKVRFIPEGRGTVEVSGHDMMVTLIGETAWVASGEWFCGS